MDEHINLNAIDKLDNINYKMKSIIGIISYINIDVCSFDDDDIFGFNLILKDLQNDIQEVKELLEKQKR